MGLDASAMETAAGRRKLKFHLNLGFNRKRAGAFLEPRTKLSHYRYLVLILAIAVSVFFQGTRGLYETTEGRYAEVSREMIEIGNYLEPTLDYSPHWTKPPLTYWTIAGGLAVFGNNAWGARFFNVIAFLGAVAAVYYLGVAICGEEVGIIAALIYLSSLLPVMGAYAVSTDTLLTLWVLLGVMAYIRAYTNADPRKLKRWIICMWLFFGLGFFTKGPPALFPLFAIGVWQLVHPGRVKIRNLWGIILFLITALSWGAWEIWQHPDLINYYVGHELADRLTSKDFHNSEWYKPLTIYLPVLLFGGGPWLFIGLYHFIKKRHPIHRGEIAAFLKTDHPIVFALYWVLLPLAIFSIVKSRLSLYMLPLFAPLVLLAAYAMFQNADDPKRLLRFTARLATVLVIFLIGLKGLSAYYPVARNIKQVWNAGRAVSAKAPIAVYDEAKLYGMEFYTEGRMKRLTRTGTESWADCSINDFLAGFKEEDSGNRSWLVLSSKNNLHSLQKIISAAGLSWQTHEQGDWQWLLLKSHT